MSFWQFPNPNPPPAPSPPLPGSPSPQLLLQQNETECNRGGVKMGNAQLRPTASSALSIVNCQLSIVHCPLNVPQCPIPRVGGACVNLSFSKPKSAFPAPGRHFSPCPSRVPFQGYGTSPDVHVNQSSLSIVRYGHPYIIRTPHGLQEKNPHVRSCVGRRRREPDSPSLVPSSAMRRSPDLPCTIRDAA